MNKRIVLSVGAMLLSGGLAWAQTGQPVPLVNGTPPLSHGQAPLPAAPAAGTVVFHTEPPAAPCDIPAEALVGTTLGYRFWAGADLLWWWVEGYELPPLVTTSPAGTPQGQAGVLGAPGTQVLFGGREVDDDSRVGIRFNAGVWFDLDRPLGVEGNFFVLDQIGTTFLGIGNGRNVLARPFIAPDPTAGIVSTAQLTGFPMTSSGSIYIATTNSLSGGEVYLREGVWNNGSLRIDALAGYRYLRLHDRLNINETSRPVTAAMGGNLTNILDIFETDNAFHGFGVGVKAEWQSNGLTLGGLAKLAFGANRRGIDISGQTVRLVPQVDPALDPGGLLALPTNSGRFVDGDFVIIPEIGLSGSFEVTPNVVVTAGYSFIYWGNVSRPGDQISLLINTTQQPPGTLSGDAVPTFVRRERDVWIQGFNVGLEIRF